MLTQPGNGRPAPEGSILIVEDDAVIASLLADLIADEGLHSIICSDGGRAYDAVVAVVPQLVILDLRLPGRDGLDVMARVKGDPRTASIPILVCSAATLLLDENASLFETWGCAVVPKPFELDVLLSTMRSMLGASRISSSFSQIS